MSKKTIKSHAQLILSLSAIGLVGVLLLAIRIEETDSYRYVFLYWNLLLAVIPVLLAWYLVHRLKSHPWFGVKQIALTLLWLVFLPNSFYIITDFIHLSRNSEAALLYDIITVASFAVSGLIFGFLSLYLMHRELSKRLRARDTWMIIVGILALSSFAVYLGRFSRWNTWDLVLAPAGLLFDVSDRVVDPTAHAETYVTTLITFLFLGAIYWAIWESTRFLSSSK